MTHSSKSLVEYCIVQALYAQMCSFSYFKVNAELNMIEKSNISAQSF